MMPQVINNHQRKKKKTKKSMIFINFMVILASLLILGSRIYFLLETSDPNVPLKAKLLERTLCVLGAFNGIAVFVAFKMNKGVYMWWATYFLIATSGATWLYLENFETVSSLKKMKIGDHWYLTIMRWAGAILFSNITSRAGLKYLYDKEVNEHTNRQVRRLMELVPGARMFLEHDEEEITSENIMLPEIIVTTPENIPIQVTADQQDFLEEETPLCQDLLIGCLVSVFE